MTGTYFSLATVNDYLICTMTEDRCKAHNLNYPCFFALTKENAPTLSPSRAVHYSETYDKMYAWCNKQPNTKSPDSQCFIIVSYQKGRNLSNDMLWFASRDCAKEYAESQLDNDDLVSRYTIYDI